MFWKLLLEGLILSGLLVGFCVWGIRDGAHNMAYLYHKDVQERCFAQGLITPERLRRNSLQFRLLAIPSYFAVLLVSVYVINGARGFVSGFWQMTVILMLVNLTDRLLIDEFWVGHTAAWIIPGTEDLRPYIDGRDKAEKWLMGTLGFALLAAGLSWVMTLLLR